MTRKPFFCLHGYVFVWSLRGRQRSESTSTQNPFSHPEIVQSMLRPYPVILPTVPCPKYEDADMITACQHRRLVARNTRSWVMTVEVKAQNRKYSVEEGQSSQVLKKANTITLATAKILCCRGDAHIKVPFPRHLKYLLFSEKTPPPPPIFGFVKQRETLTMQSLSRLIKYYSQSEFMCRSQG